MLKANIKAHQLLLTCLGG